MKTTMLFAALVFGAVTTQQAVACDWELHADASDRTIVACDNTGCHAIGPSTAQEEPAAPNSATPQVAEEPAGPAPTIVACQGSNC
jgi:hypothetical protein